MQAADIIRLPFSSDLSKGGIAYATRSVARSIGRRDASIYNRIRHSAACAAVELAFRRYLTECKIPFQVKTLTAFTDLERYDVSMGGHRCILTSYLISKRTQIRNIHTNPDILLDAPAIIPLDEDAIDGLRDDDLHLFAFATGLTASKPDDLTKAVDAGQPVYMLHILPRSWATPKTWISPGKFALKSEADVPLTVEIHGQTENREIVSGTLILPPHVRIEAQLPYFSISSIHAENPPDGRVGIHNPRRGETYIIQPNDWDNVWVYGMHIHLVGWMSRAEYRKHASLIQPGSRILQFSRTRLKNLSVPVRDLHPVSALLEKAESWKKAGRTASPIIVE